MGSTLIEIVIEDAEAWTDGLLDEGLSDEAIVKAMTEKVKMYRPRTTIPIKEKTWRLKRRSTGKGHAPVIFKGDTPLRTMVVSSGKRGNDEFMILRVWH
jgi:hypothetical protein